MKKMNNVITPHPIGRPSKLTREAIARLVAALCDGHTRATAAALAGIGESTLYAWLAAAKRSDAAPEYLDFLDAITMAENTGEDALLQIIRAAAPKSWQAAAWILERRRPDHWSKKVKAEIEVSPPVKVDDDQVSRDIAEAQRTADLTCAIVDCCRRGLPFEEWPPEVLAFSGYESLIGQKPFGGLTLYG